MSCNTIDAYLAFSWVGEVLHSDDKVAIAFDTQHKNYEIAYLTNRPTTGDGRVRCSTFRDMSKIDAAFERAKRDGALHIEHIADVIKRLR
jgi:hypothetical protein